MTTDTQLAWLERTWDSARDDGLLGASVVRFTGSDVGVGAVRADLRVHLDRWGPRGSWASDGGRLHDWVREVGLAGRGGAHFPVAVKWEAARSAGPGGTVVINAAEGEPAAAKDGTLLQFRPHLVLDGATDVAEVIGAREIVLWVHEDAHASIASVRHALEERRRNDPRAVPVRVLTTPERYVSGEASSVIRGVRGGPALPLLIRDPARPWGDGPPVLVHNTETLARVAALGRTGPSDHVPTSLLTVTTTSAPATVRERSVVEVFSYESLADAVARTGAEPPRAVLVGGYGGTWHAWQEVADAPADQGDLRDRGLSLGAGVLLLLPSGRRVLDEAGAIADYMAGQSAMQCGPCTFGLPAVARALRSDRRRLMRLLGLVEGRGACRHPDGTARMIRSAVAVAAAIGEG